MGQQSTQIAKNFTSVVSCSGVILTKTEGDTRGGCAINIRYETKIQIKYIGTGEKADDFEEFHPSRIASRLLDRGDIETVVEKAFEEFGEKNVNDMKNRILSGKMTYSDYLTQIQTMKKMGGLSKVMSFLPGASNMAGMMNNINMAEFGKQEAMILSMTQKERNNPKLLELHSSRRVRVSRGSGTTLADVKKLMNQIEKMAKMSDVMKKMQNNGISMDDLKNFDISQLQKMLKN
jgi:signal recognition particle subunit SRP54